MPVTIFRIFSLVKPQIWFAIETRRIGCVPVILSSKTLGRIGLVGFIDVNVETGELQLAEKDAQEIEDNARRLSGGSMTVSHRTP